MNTQTVPAVGATVRFAEGTPQFAANEGIDYIVEPSPSGKPFSVGADGRVYVWLVMAADAAKAPSRRGRRTGWASSLVEGI
jgi:hypothetical protein